VILIVYLLGSLDIYIIPCIYRWVLQSGNIQETFIPNEYNSKAKGVVIIFAEGAEVNVENKD
jgi:hypothetical protein